MNNQKECDIKFSVIIPLYNKANYIKHTLLSVIQQSYSNFEIIVVNDGSTDNSLEIVQGIHDFRLKIFSKKNEGVSAARNYGINKAVNPYIAFIDADDRWDSLYLEKICMLIQRYPEARVFSSSFAEVYKGKIIPTKTYKYIPADLCILDYIDIFSKCYISPINTSATVVAKEVLRENLFNSRIYTGEDLLLWLQLALKYKIAYIKEPLSYYNRDVGGSITRRLIPLKNNFILYIKNYFPSPPNNLNRLIDALILRMLRPYYVNNISPAEVKRILDSIEWSKQEIMLVLFYKLPKPLVQLLYKFAKKLL